MATILKTDGTSEQRDHISFKECQEAVGGYVEPVYLEDKTILANEEGLVHQLPMNHAATVLAGRPLVGDVVVLDLSETELVLDKGGC
jgi:hypothetical protein